MNSFSEVASTAVSSEAPTSPFDLVPESASNLARRTPGIPGIRPLKRSCHSPAVRQNELSMFGGLRCGRTAPAIRKGSEVLQRP